MSHTKRMREQEWLYDRLIRSGGPDFYWPMTEEVLGAVGMDGAGDIKAVRLSIRKFVDLTREMRRIAAKREAIAREAEALGHRVTARQNYFTASCFYTMAQGPIHADDDPTNLDLSLRKNACYEGFIAHAEHKVEKIEIPFGKTSLPGYLHFPPGASGRVPCVVFLGGMDNFKELLVMSPSDKFLERGMAVLAFDGPGQNEARITRKICCTESNFIEAGKAAMDFLVARSDIDPSRIGIAGISMGSFWLTQIVAFDQRYKAAAGFYVCHEPGQDTLLNRAIPVFRDRYMWMAGYADDAAFDVFAKKLTLEGLGSRITCPYLMVAGEDDDLSPIEYSHKLYDELAGPKTMVVYKGELHGVTDNLDVRAFIADWMKDRFDGKTLASRRIYKDCRTGQEVKP
jgi:fermentation-respiration switch protein FrsA (DUF1100 family)